MVQALNASGGRAEDIVESFQLLVDEIDKAELISQRKRDFLKEMMGAIYNAIVDTEGIARKQFQFQLNSVMKRQKFLNMPISRIVA